MNASELANSICSDIIQGVELWNGIGYIVTQFEYPDGDHVPVYVEQNGVISDRGTTLYKLAVIGLDITKARLDTISAICQRYNVVLEDDELSASLDDNGNSFLKFCEAVTRISSLAYELRSRRIVTLGDQIQTLLSERVSPSRTVHRDWSAAEVDPRRAYPVDFRVNTIGVARHIFHVSNAQKSDKVAAVSNFLQLHEIAVPTLTIVSELARLPSKHRSRLEMASTEIRYNGLEGNEDFLVSFALESA